MLLPRQTSDVQTGVPRPASVRSSISRPSVIGATHLHAHVPCSPPLPASPTHPLGRRPRKNSSDVLVLSVPCSPRLLPEQEVQTQRRESLRSQLGKRRPESTRTRALPPVGSRFTRRGPPGAFLVDSSWPSPRGESPLPCSFAQQFPPTLPSARGQKVGERSGRSGDYETGGWSTNPSWDTRAKSGWPQRTGLPAEVLKA